MRAMRFERDWEKIRLSGARVFFLYTLDWTAPSLFVAV